jgi:hypothetical protein
MDRSVEERFLGQSEPHVIWEDGMSAKGLLRHRSR